MRMDYDKLFFSVGYIDSSLLSNIYIPSFEEVEDSTWDMITAYRELTKIRAQLIIQETISAPEDPTQRTNGQWTSLNQDKIAKEFWQQVYAKSLLLLKGSAIANVDILDGDIWKSVEENLTTMAKPHVAKLWTMILRKIFVQFWSFKETNAEFLTSPIEFREFVTATLERSYWDVKSIEAILKAGAKRDYSKLDVDTGGIEKDIGTIVNIYYNYPYLVQLERVYVGNKETQHEGR